MRSVLLAGLLLFTAGFGVLSSQGVAQVPGNAPVPMADIIARYEAFALAGDPARAAREDGRAPDRWGTVVPEAVEGRRAEAEALLADLARASDADPVDRGILEALLAFTILRAEHDIGRIPFTGDYGFHAEPVFAALRARILTTEDADAWLRRLADIDRYFAENIANMRRGVETGWTSYGDPLSVTV
ncbi:MAG: DUF885 family protein, partial [Pseudomonadota bacterium]